MISFILITIISYIGCYGADKDFFNQHLNAHNPKKFSLLLTHLSTPALQPLLNTPIQKIPNLQNLPEKDLFILFKAMYPEAISYYPYIPFELEHWRSLENIPAGATMSPLEVIIEGIGGFFGTPDGAFKHREYKVCNCEKKEHDPLAIGLKAKNNYVMFGELPESFNGICTRSFGNTIALLNDGDIYTAVARLKGSSFINNNHVCTLYSTVDINGKKGIFYEQKILDLIGSMDKNNPIVKIYVDSNIDLKTHKNEIINIVQQAKNGEKYETHLVAEKSESGKKLRNFILYAISKLIQKENLRAALELNHTALNPTLIKHDDYTWTNLGLRRFYTTTPLVSNFKEAQQQKLRNALEKTMLNTIDTQLLSYNEAQHLVETKLKDQEKILKNFCTPLPYLKNIFGDDIAQ